ncbi:protein Mis18-beta [Cololabis saira]|uniref:protein Mis18-beta n=1 Tax=Cololabis saira TaxID=129043 RepID=UPI002AD1E75B|nr:protein Mis18-beta [Cololabis saira]
MEFEGSVLIKREDAVRSVKAADQLMTLHCLQCNTILADSLHVCGEIKCLDSVMCTRVTNDVVVGDGIMSGHKGEMADCIYSPLTCRSCQVLVGKRIDSSPSHLASVRQLFLLCKPKISCYVLNSCSMVSASTLSFEVKPVTETTAEVRRQFELQLDRMLRLKSRLAQRGVITKKRK